MRRDEQTCESVSGKLMVLFCRSKVHHKKDDDGQPIETSQHSIRPSFVILLSGWLSQPTVLFLTLLISPSSYLSLKFAVIWARTDFSVISVHPFIYRSVFCILFTGENSFENFFFRVLFRHRKCLARFERSKT
jgi:hypothetical protein